MFKLTVFLCSIPCAKLDGSVQQELKDAAVRVFCEVYGVKPSQASVSLRDGSSPNWDLAVAYEELPNVPDAMSAKLNRFRDALADELFRVFPATLGYSGRVTVRNIERIAFSPSENRHKTAARRDDDEASYEEMAQMFQAEVPRFTFDQLVLADSVRERLLESISVLENREKLFEEWNLKAIMSPSVLLNLYGDTGTGKSMTAEALASYVGKKIIRTTYADIESKYHGEGPKRLKAIFLAAKLQDAVLFIDEADSMLSARLTDVSDGSAQAINSMRSQLLISLENYEGIVIFATNLIKNYDKAFLSRLICVEIKRPTREARREIWRNHLFPKGNDEKTLRIPLANDIDLEFLSEYDFCGRDIRNAVKQACISTVLKKKERVDQEELLQASERILKELEEVKTATHRDRAEGKLAPMDPEEKSKLIDSVKKIGKNKDETQRDS